MFVVFESGSPLAQGGLYSLVSEVLVMKSAGPTFNTQRLREESWALCHALAFLEVRQSVASPGSMGQSGQSRKPKAGEGPCLKT